MVAYPGVPSPMSSNRRLGGGGVLGDSLDEHGVLKTIRWGAAELFYSDGVAGHCCRSSSGDFLGVHPVCFF